MSESLLAEQMRIELAKGEVVLEDGSKVSNLEGICQMLINRSLDGDMAAVDYIAKLTEGKKVKGL